MLSLQSLYITNFSLFGNGVAVVIYVMFLLRMGGFKIPTCFVLGRNGCG